MTRDSFDASNASGAYALGALSDAERAHFEDELAQSEELRAEVAGLVDTAAVLALAVKPVDPPPVLKSNIMALLDSIPQLPAESERESVAVGRSDVASDAGQSDIAPVVSLSDHVPTGRSERSARRRIRPLTALVAAAAAVALFAGGALAGGLLGTLGGERQSDQFAALNAASDATREVTPLAGGGTAVLISSQELDKAAVVLNGAPELSDGEVYQLWLLHDQKATSAGILDPDGPQEYAVMEGALDPGYAMAMTIEPEGGSDQPTGVPMLLTGA
jgi:anti-sigma-K factor RskA